MTTRAKTVYSVYFFVQNQPLLGRAGVPTVFTHVIRGHPYSSSDQFATAGADPSHMHAASGGGLLLALLGLAPLLSVWPLRWVDVS